MTKPTPFRHDRKAVAGLQHAHADHIESIYRGLAARPDDPDGAEVRLFGRTRVFAVNRDRLENRAIFTGNERSEDFDRVFAYFADRGVRCVIEINPANFLRSEPFSWDSEVVPLLLAKGCTIEDFRCVWCCDRPPERRTSPRIQRFGPDGMERYLGELDRVYPEGNALRSGDAVRHGEGGEEWLHYVGYEGDRPVSTGTLYGSGESGYLAWWYTNPSYRR